MSTLRIAAILIFVILCVGGCTTCKDHLLVHVEDANSGTPVAGASIKFCPPINLLPPPVWRGRTNAQGDLHICVDFDDGLLRMILLHEGFEYGGMFGKNELMDRPNGIVWQSEIYQGKGPTLTFTVRLIDAE